MAVAEQNGRRLYAAVQGGLMDVDGIYWSRGFRHPAMSMGRDGRDGALSLRQTFHISSDAEVPASIADTNRKVNVKSLFDGNGKFGPSHIDQ